MLSQSSDWETIIALEKENEQFIQQLLQWKEAREFLNLIGFNDVRPKQNYLFKEIYLK
jgi:hypothetical protein